MYIFNNLIIIFHRKFNQVFIGFLHRMNLRFEVLIQKIVLACP